MRVGYSQVMVEILECGPHCVALQKDKEQEYQYYHQNHEFAGQIGQKYEHVQVQEQR